MLPNDDFTMIECQKCGWVGNHQELVAPYSSYEPSCPECFSDDFLDKELDAGV